jgi:hypothetical protein
MRTNEVAKFRYLQCLTSWALTTWNIQVCNPGGITIWHITARLTSNPMHLRPLLSHRLQDLWSQSIFTENTCFNQKHIFLLSFFLISHYDFKNNGKGTNFGKQHSLSPSRQKEKGSGFMFIWPMIPFYVFQKVTLSSFHDWLMMRGSSCKTMGDATIAKHSMPNTRWTRWTLILWRQTITGQMWTITSHSPCQWLEQ